MQAQRPNLPVVQWIYCRDQKHSPGTGSPPSTAKVAVSGTDERRKAILDYEKFLQASRLVAASSDPIRAVQEQVATEC